MPASYANQDLIEFQRVLHQKWWDLLDSESAYPFTASLEPDNCGDFEYERRKNEIVRYILAVEAAGATVPSVDFTLCGNWATDVGSPA